MIRILHMSDLHLEMERWRLNIVGWAAFMAQHLTVPKHLLRGPMIEESERVDLIVLAGDVHNSVRGIVYADQLSRFLQAPAVYVAGNHEFYHQNIERLLPALHRAAARTNGRVSFLENNVATFTFDQQRLNVLGCTLWTDYDLYGDPAGAMHTAVRRINDHDAIHTGRHSFAPEDALRRHLASRVWLHKTLARLRHYEAGSKNLIVTHHAPSGAALGERSGGIGPAYASELLLEFASYVPAAWIHGHTHFRHESEEEGIRFVSAPRGYVLYDGMAAQEYRPGILEL
ncbi:metallophosphoesterase [Acidocella sp.]|jgi:predicted phosphodiesterase|uniref:metallophosphoesterase n=1 Tax=Acidocella sp. TaxID=50710 RepID=UPI002F3E52A4